jgi:hypothetical protein
MMKRVRALILISMLLILGAVMLSFVPNRAIAQIRAALVRDIDERGRNPFQQTGQCSGFSDTCSIAFTTVPANKRLVVEEVSSRSTVRSTVQILQSDLRNSQVGLLNNQPMYVIPQLQWSSGGTSQYVSNNRVVYYVEPGQTPVWNMITIGTGAILVDVTLTGYFVDLSN